MTVMMYMRMGTAAKAKAKYWVNVFKSDLLPEDDLNQEAYLIFLRCQDFFDPNRSASFLTYYSRSLRNHFATLYRQARRRERIEGWPIGSLGEEELILGDWTAPDILEWEELIELMIPHFSGRLLGLFLILIEPTKELIDLSLGSSGNITSSSLGRYFGVKRTIIESQRKKIEELLIKILDSRLS